MLRSLKIAVIRLAKQCHGESYKPPNRRKQPTRGSKQILRENLETVRFYHVMIFAVTFLRPVLSMVINGYLSVTGFTWGSVLSYIFIPLVSLFLLGVMIKHAMPLYNNSAGEKLLDPGYDLNMPGGYGDVLKDLIVLLVLTHVLSVASPMFWYILLLLVVRVLHIIWKYVIFPFFFKLTKSNDSRRKKPVKKAKKLKNPKKHKQLRSIKHWHCFR